MDRQSGTAERWGDYLGIQSKFDNPCFVYSSGYYSIDFNRNSTWVSELISPDTSVVYDCPVETGSKVYPNPSGIYEDINIEFTLETTQDISAYIYDLNGRLVRKIAETKDCLGTNILSFSTEHLSSGIYVIRIYGENENEILSEKFIKN